MSAASETLEFIFVRVPRTGSTTFLHHLTEEFTAGLVDINGQHATAAELRDRWDDDWERFFTFRFIRNPWDWLVSVYNSGIPSGAGVKELWPSALEEPADAPWLHPGQRINAPFGEWVQQRKTTPVDWLAIDGDIAGKRVYMFEDMITRATVHLSAMPHAPYREWYTPELAEYVADKCRCEIALGGYSY